MRWFVLLLLMANLILFVWTQQQSRQTAALREVALPEIGHLRLMSEVGEDDSEAVTFVSDILYRQPLVPAAPATVVPKETESQRQTTRLPEADRMVSAVPSAGPVLQASADASRNQAVTAPEAIDGTASAAMESESPATLAAAAGSAVPVQSPEARCSRIGPLTADDADALVNRLPAQMKLVSDVSEEYAQVNGYYVLIPVLASRAAGLRKLQELADAGFEDTWLFRSGALRNAISLGLFRREASARRHAERVQNKGFTTEVKENTSLRERRWLVVRDAREGNAAIDLSLPEGVNVERHDCP